MFLKIAAKKKLQKSIFRKKKLFTQRCQAAGDQYVRQKTSEYINMAAGAVNTKLISSHISISIEIQSFAA